MARGIASTARAVVAFIVAAVLGLSAPAAQAQVGIDIYQRSPFPEAVARGDLAKVRGMLANGQSPNAFDLEGRPAILLAAWQNHIEIVETLVESKVRVDDKDKTGGTALIAAAERGFDRVVELLIKGKANVNLDNRQGLTPLIAAAKNGHLRVVQLLVKAGARLEQQDFTGRTALEWAENSNRRPVAEFLRRSGAKS